MNTRWTKKYEKLHFGYKNHINIDKEHKLIRKWIISSASQHDSQAFEDIYIHAKDLPVYADSAYKSRKIEKSLS